MDKSRVRNIGVLLVVLGAVSIFLEYAFYQYVDESGMLHESLFLPLGVFSTVFGFLVLLISLVCRSWTLLRRDRR